jgi:DNA polymerase-3 subunit gamma/tau
MLRKAAEPLRAPAGLFQAEPVRIAASDSYRLNENLELKRAADVQPTAVENGQPTVLAGPEDAIDIAKLVALWKQYAADHAADGPRSLYTTLVGADPTIEDNLIRFKVINRIQERDLSECKGALLESLRASLNNVKLQLSIELDEQQEVRKEFLTEREKYARMAEKNPLLEELRKRFDLDLLA